ncbi:hypothetical protein [Rubrivirga litoralis]|uniref:Uncharacterized protein n=1 Tax=Rubrivirga litoralis TaxID=3075598 RepID=A0ABU3BPV3_9BACT|nr:hypothetical protein [Rubrivirga sp. F394]MDT0631318.1 hypothetical protein [Rubrivirga sp. F394]
MLTSLPIIPARQVGIWEAGCPECEAHQSGDCLGHETAPCRCTWVSADRRHRCERCALVCRDRTTEREGVHADTFAGHMGAGIGLGDVRVFQPRAFGSIPAFVPLRTHELPAGGHAAGFEWVGVDLKTLFHLREDGTVTLRDPFRSGRGVRSFLGVSEKANLLAVLNGKDDLLEGFWGADRPRLLRHLADIGFVACTGPTFSVYEQIKEADRLLGDGRVVQDLRPVQAAHTAVMFRRHHRCVAEAAGVSLVPIPNLYDLTAHHRETWARWLRANPNVHCVTRDFSRTPMDGDDYRRHLGGLIEILSGAGRPLHVLLVGVGLGKAEGARVLLREAGCTASVVTGDPIVQAVTGGKGLDAEGNRYEPRPEASRADLAVSNLLRFSARVREDARVAQ